MTRGFSPQLSRQEFLQLRAKPTQRLQPVRSRLDDFLLSLENLPSIPLDQDANRLPHPPPRRSQHLQSLRRRHKQRNAIIPHHTHTFRKPVKGLKIKSSKIKSLQLSSRISHGGFL